MPDKKKQPMDECHRWEPRIVVAVLIVVAYIILTGALYWNVIPANSANERLLIQQLGALSTALGVVVVSLFPNREQRDASTISKLIDVNANSTPPPAPGTVTTTTTATSPDGAVVPPVIDAPGATINATDTGGHDA